MRVPNGRPSGLLGRMRHHVLAVASAATVLATHAQPLAERDGPLDLSAELETIRRSHDLPSLVAAAYRDGELIGSGAAGYYSMEHADRVTTASKYHIGSCTKAMTAVIIASLVDEGALRWDLTLHEALPAYAPLINAAYDGVTVSDLLAHRSGINERRDPGLANLPWTLLIGMGDAAPEEQRAELVKTVLAAKPSAEPREEYAYSNFGYIVAAAVAEEAAGEPWETLIRERVFEPLEMTSAGFGPPGVPTTAEADRVIEPLGHRKQDEWMPMMLLEGRPAPDNPLVYNPAGRVHASIVDWGRFVADFEEGLDGDGALLSAESYRALATDAEDDGYALGWIVTERPWAGGAALTHAGSNTMWFAVAWIAPDKNLAMVAAVNAATSEAQTATDEAIGVMLDAFTFTPEMLEAISPSDD